MSRPHTSVTDIGEGHVAQAREGKDVLRALRAHGAADSDDLAADIEKDAGLLVGGGDGDDVEHVGWAA